MASRVGLIVRTTTARERSTAALVHIFAENDLGSVEAQAPQDRDADVAAMLREEWLADVLEALAFGTPADPETEDPDAEDHVLANPGFVDMSREDLEEVAVAWYQIDPAQYPDDMALRQALMAAYEADTGDGETDHVEISDKTQELMKLPFADLKERAIAVGLDADEVGKERSRKGVIALLMGDPNIHADEV